MLHFPWWPILEQAFHVLVVAAARRVRAPLLLSASAAALAALARHLVHELKALETVAHQALDDQEALETVAHQALDGRALHRLLALCPTENASAEPTAKE